MRDSGRWNEVDQAIANAPTHDHLLLTVLGTQARSARYALNGREREAQLAPLALLDLLPPDARPNRVLAICTPEAQQTSWPVLRDGLGDGVRAEVVEVSGEATEDAANKYMTSVASAVPVDAGLTVDITHGFRHYSFLTYLAVLYLSQLRGLRVWGAYYRLLQEGTSPFVDLKPLLLMPGWIHAVQVLRDTGSALPMVRAIEAGRSSGDSPPSEISVDLARFLKRLSEVHLSGLPLETGHLVSQYLEQWRRPLARLFRNEHGLPLSDELAGQLREFLEPFRLTRLVRGQGLKGKVPLTDGELQRQAGMVDYHLEHGDLSTAFGLMREWTVSWALWQQGVTDDWLDYHNHRDRVASLLNAVRSVSKNSKHKHVLSEEQRRLGKFWGGLTRLRNGFHHHGMRREPLSNNSFSLKKMGKVTAYWQTLKLCPNISLSIGESSGRHVLVSPIGFRPGSLYSAVRACREDSGGEAPGLCIVSCSAESGEMVQDALGHAGYQGRVELLTLVAPYGGVDEIKALAKRVEPLLIGAKQVSVNVTGGTTLMGLAAEQVAASAKSLACPVWRFGLIDRRSPEQQAADPYQEGEVFPIERTSGVSAAGESEGENGC